MKKEKKLSFNLPENYNLLSNQEMRDGDKQGKHQNILLSEIDDFENHPFSLGSEEEMAQLVKSIETQGVLVPIIVRQKNDGRYEMVSGHRRKYACEQLGYTVIPAVIKVLNRDEAIMCMTDTNIHRENTLLCEKAQAIKMRLEAMNRQGKRTDLTSVQFEQKLENKESRQKLAEELGMSSSKLYRLCRLTYLIPEVQEIVNEGRMALGPAEHISFLSKEYQEMLYTVMMPEGTDKQDIVTPSLSQAVKLKLLFKEGVLTIEGIEDIMDKPKANQRDRISIELESIKGYMPNNLTPQKTKEHIIKALESYSVARDEKDYINCELIMQYIPERYKKDPEKYILDALEYRNARLRNVNKDRDSR